MIVTVTAGNCHLSEHKAVACSGEQRGQYQFPVAFYLHGRNVYVHRNEKRVFRTRYDEVGNRNLVVRYSPGKGPDNAKHRRQADTKYFLCYINIHSLCVLKSIYQINGGFRGTEVMMRFDFAQFSAAGSAWITVVTGVDVSHT